ncbi:hypothetical protein [Halostella salina]|uniref:hypothetical protein n=1 Tax=Halostella salina TaxID=1547897 RepID=UPI0013CF26AE|nr:hypothetical protein [Halostella salina]
MGKVSGGPLPPAKVITHLVSKPSHSTSIYRDDEGNAVGVKINVTEGGDERTVQIAADEKGNLQLGGVGPNGEKRGKADPSGNGNNPLGK